MDERYLSELFGTKKGYVAVASKAGEGKADWTEKSFLWPNDRAELIAWVDSRRNTDLFICPALRRSPGRRKNDGAHLQWLWADVDFQSIPEKHWPKIRSRIQRLGCIIVRSGTGENCHVYVRLDRTVHLDVWRRLNLGLRKALMADAKHTDNALLRIPGTQNYKPGGKAVTMESGRGVVRVPDRLLKQKPWSDVVVTDDVANDGTWERVDLPALPGGVRARVNMDVDEGVGRYGTRHAAVYQVSAWLSKRGYTSDEIHTLMSEFKPGLDKEDSERGYDMHADISRCLAQHPTREVVDDTGVAVAEELTGIEDADDATPEELYKADILREIKRRDIKQAADQYIAQRNFTPWPEEISEDLDEALASPLPDPEYAIDDMVVVGQTVSITGQYKSGKTMLATNLARALCDHTPFLGDRKVRELKDGETVGLWSLEMNRLDLLGYIAPQGVEQRKKLKMLHGRGYNGAPLMTDVGKAVAVNWLRDRGVGVWIIDSWARVCRMSGVDENDNAAVIDLFRRLEQIKREAGVSEMYLLAHTGRALQEEGNERARGATGFDDSADVRWVFTIDGDVRFLSVVRSRGVKDMKPTSVTFNEDNNHLTLGGQDKVDARLATAASLVVQLVSEMPPRHYNVTALKRVLREKSSQKSDKGAAAAIREAEDTGFIQLVDGPNRSKMVELTPSRSSGEGKRATARVLDMSNVKDRPVRKAKKRRHDDA